MVSSCKSFGSKNQESGPSSGRRLLGRYSLEKGTPRFVLKGNCADSGTINRNKCHEYYANYFDFLDSLKKRKKHDFLADSDINNPDGGLCTKKCYLCDPLTFAHMINHEDVIMLNSNFDWNFLQGNLPFSYGRSSVNRKYTG